MLLIVTILSVVIAATAIPPINEQSIKLLRDESCRATAPYIAYEDDTNTLMVSWTLPSACVIEGISYRVLLHINGTEEIVPLITPGIPIVQYSLEVAPTCETIGAIVETIDADSNPIIQTEAVYLNIKMPAVDVINTVQTTEGIQLTWDEVFVGEFCDVDYKVIVGDNEPDVAFDPEYLIPTENLNICAKMDVKVQTISNGFISAEKQIEVEVKMPAVDIEAKNEDNVVVINFTPLDIATIPAECGSVSYRVVEKGETCFKSSYSVIAIPTSDVPGVEATKVVPKTPSAVNNLDVDVRGNEVLVEWTSPSGGDTCNLEYFAQYGDEVVGPIHSTSVAFPYNTIACTLDKVEVWATSDYIIGYKTSFDIVGDLDEVGNLICLAAEDKTTATCTWEKPAGCADAGTNMSYRVVYYNGANVETIIIESEAITFDIVSCSSNWVTVTALLSDDVDGDSKEVIIEGC